MFSTVLFSSLDHVPWTEQHWLHSSNNCCSTLQSLEVGEDPLHTSKADSVV